LAVPRTIGDALDYLALELRQTISSAARAQAVVKVLQERRVADEASPDSGQAAERADQAT